MKNESTKPVGRTGIAVIGAALAALPLVAQEPAPPRQVQTAPVVEVPQPGRPIDLAICLDTSGSMSGLIESAKQRIWAIVNDLALAEPVPRLRVALLTYGHSGHDAARGWVRIDAPLTDDLDRISQQLFALTTSGGTELVGRVLKTATDELAWAEGADALKLIVVAGNETADQDREVPYREACAAAISRGILVNSIFCGSPTDPIAAGWRELALLADGQFASIDRDHGTVVVTTPFDAELIELGTAVNDTYIPLGRAGQAGAANQVAQDANAAGLNGEAAASRALAKNGALYVCSWDLVDALEQGSVKLEEVEEEELPENMRAMTLVERQAHVDGMKARRGEIKRRADALAAQRQQFIEAELRRQGSDESKAFDRVLREAIRGQAAGRGFRFEEPEPVQPAEEAPVEASQKGAGD